MKLATYRNGSRDGQLVVVSRDLEKAIDASGIASSLQSAIENWDKVEPDLRNLYAKLNDGPARDAQLFDLGRVAAPLPRAMQWLDGSAFPSHAALMAQAFKLAPAESSTPLMYQGMSDHFYGPVDDVLLPSEDHGIDFEAEIGVVTRDVSMGSSAEDALGRICLLVLINDWSLRALAPAEMKTGFGWIQAKPASSLGPVALTPDELGPNWRDGRIDATLNVWLNGSSFGSVSADQMAFGFHDLIAHASRTRSLSAGTIVGSGTVSSPHARECGSCCIAERRAIEEIDHGSPATSYMRFGDQVRIEAVAAGRCDRLFGSIDQRVLKSRTKDSS